MFQVMVNVFVNFLSDLSIRRDLYPLQNDVQNSASLLCVGRRSKRSNGPRTEHCGTSWVIKSFSELHS